MDFKVFLSSDALTDLERIVAYVARFWHGPDVSPNSSQFAMSWPFLPF
jgi:hypothetical protein